MFSVKGRILLLTPKFYSILHNNMACEGATLAQVFVLEFSHKLYYYFFAYPHDELLFKYNCDIYGTLAAFLFSIIKVYV